MECNDGKCIETRRGVLKHSKNTCMKLNQHRDNHMILYVVVIFIMAITVSTTGLMEYFWTSENIRSVNDCFEDSINDVNGTINKSAFMICNFDYNNATGITTTAIIALHVIVIISTVNASTLYQKIKISRYTDMT